jgi:hypothetical protein
MGVAALVVDRVKKFPALAQSNMVLLLSGGMGGSGSLILQHQLEDKLKAHRHLITFLKALNIWQEVMACRACVTSALYNVGARGATVSASDHVLA